MASGYCNTATSWDDTPAYRYLFGLPRPAHSVVELCRTKEDAKGGHGTERSAVTVPRYCSWMSSPVWARSDAPMFPTREVRLLWLAAEHGFIGPGRFAQMCVRRLHGTQARLQSVQLIGLPLTLQDDLQPRWPLGRVMAELGIDEARWVVRPC